MLYFCDTLAASHLNFFFFIKKKNHYKTVQPHEKTNKTYRKQKPDKHESKPANVSNNNVSAERTKLDKGILNLKIYDIMWKTGKLNKYERQMY